MSLIDWVTNPSIIASLVSLTAMEIVLGIDNIVFISLIVGRLPPEEGKRARQIGLGLALVFRVALLSAVFVLIGLTAPLFTLMDHAVSFRDLVLLAGGLFLLVKATQEIHTDVEGDPHEGEPRPTPNFGATVAQIVVIDIVFSIDSIVTAVGMAEYLQVMIAAVILAVAVMYLAAGSVARFIEMHPTTRMLALSFLLMIGFALIADGAGFHIPRGYLYTAMAFSTAVEILNVLARRNRAKRRQSQ
jgi:predicted tellurium resistance membrane protein TerC